MPNLRKISVTWNGLLPELSGLVAQWKPPKLKSEIAYRNHLFGYVRQAVPDDIQLEKEYRDRGTTMDLWLRWKGHFVSEELAFELKVNLKRKADCDRLIGQIEDLNPRENLILLVLIGETDHALLGRLREKYAEQIKPSVGFDAKLAIVQVAPSEEAP